MATTDARTGKAKSEALSVSKLKDAADLSRKFESLKSGRTQRDNQWRINLAFYKGRQYTFWNKSSGRIEELPTADGDKPRFRVRIVSNQIVSGAQSLLAKYTKTKPVIAATPGSSDDHDVKAAQMAERLMEFWWSEFQLDDKLEEALLWGIIAGQGYWKVTWDQHAGKAMKFLMHPETGQPIVNEGLRTMFMQELREAQLPVEQVEQTVYLGDIRVEAVSPFDVYLDPTAKTFQDCKYAICVHHLDPDEIKARWGVDVDADSVPADNDTALPTNDNVDDTDKCTKAVYIGYFLPTPALPKGRVVTWLDEPKDILEDLTWEQAGYPENVLPLVKLPGVRVPGSIYDDAVVSHAIPLQRELNRTISQIVEYKNLTIKPRVWAPVGSLRQRLTNEPGAVYEFTPIGGLKPEIEQLPSMPPYVFEHLRDISGRLKEVFGLAEVTEGKVGPNVEAGVAIDLLQEMATDKLAPTIKLIEKAIEQAGQQMLSLAQRYYVEPRLLKIKGSSGSTAVEQFTQADIVGGVDIHVESGSGLPRTRAGRQARVEKMVEMGVIRPDQSWKYLDIADMKSVAAKYAADEDQAYREHDKLLKGAPLNPYAVQQAMQVVNTPDPLMGVPVNPQTGQPFQGPEDMQAFVMDAALEPLEFENAAAHLDVHGQYMKSVEFEQLPAEQQSSFITHFSKTQQRVSAMQQVENNVKTTLQVKATAGPTAVSQLMQQSGAKNVTPDMLKEAPLETWISDSVDKPDDPNAVTAPHQAYQQALKEEQGMQHADSNQEQAQLSQEQSMAHAEARAQREQEKHDQAMRHADEQHQHGMKMAERKSKESNSGTDRKK